MSILNQQKILVLNSAWCCIGTKSVQQGLSDLVAGSFFALDMADGYMTPTKWIDWIKLPVRDEDDVVRTIKFAIRVPRVLVAKNYKKVPVRRKQLNMKNLREHYDDTCAYTGKKLSGKTASKEHYIPLSHGGKTDWSNILLVDRNVNSKRGNQSLEDAGLKLMVQPTEPKPLPIADTIRNPYGLPEWDLLLKKK